MRILLSILLGLSIYSCSDKQIRADNEKINSEAFQFPDSLFPFQNIQNSLIINKFWYDSKHNYELFADSASRTPFIHLDSAQKLKLIVPIMVKEMNIDTNYILHYMDAIFVSKQKYMGDLTPIIVWVSGDDYGALFYILLDKTSRPVSHFLMNGGFNGGPSDGPDSTLELSPVIHSFIKANTISSYSLTEFIRPDSIIRPSIFDSVNYSSKILPSGQIETKRLDSIRFEAMPRR